jgi:heat shock protein HtpX
MAVAGVAVFLLYAAGAWFVYRALLYVWAQRPDPVTTVLAVLGLTLAFGVMSYRGGQAALRREIDARGVPRERAPGLYRRVEAMADEMGIEAPTLSVARMGQPNALALGGPRGGDVVLDVGLFRLLTEAELEAIIAHELAHLETNDGLVKTLGSSLVRTVTGLVLLALLPLVILATGFGRGVAYLRGASPAGITEQTAVARSYAVSGVVVVLFVFTLALRAYSRRRELAADDRAAAVTGQPVALARALAKVDRAAGPAEGLLSNLVIHGDEAGTLTRLLATHPPMDDRVRRLAGDAAVAGRPRALEGSGVRIEIE